MSFGSRDLLARSPAECTVPQCGRRVRIGVHSIWKGLPLSDVNNSWPLVPAMLETLPYPLGFFFFGSSPWLQAVDEFASKSLTSHQRTNRRRQHQLNSMSMSQDKGARPISAIQTKANGDRSEGERAGGLRVEEEEWGSGVTKRARQGAPPLHPRSDAEWRLYKIAHRSQKFPPSPLRRRERRKI